MAWMSQAEPNCLQSSVSRFHSLRRPWKFLASRLQRHLVLPDLGLQPRSWFWHSLFFLLVSLNTLCIWAGCLGYFSKGCPCSHSVSNSGACLLLIDSWQLLMHSSLNCFLWPGLEPGPHTPLASALPLTSTQALCLQISSQLVAHYFHFFFLLVSFDDEKLYVLIR